MVHPGLDTMISLFTLSLYNSYVRLRKILENVITNRQSLPLIHTAYMS